MSRVNEEELPLLSIFSMEDIQRMALGQMLGTNDIRQYMAENTVEYKAVMKPNVGLAITVTKVSPTSKGA